jgi:hypothetical protein
VRRQVSKGKVFIVPGRVRFEAAPKIGGRMSQAHPLEDPFGDGLDKGHDKSQQARARGW